MSLATITAVSLPPQAYAHTEGHDVNLTADPASFRPVTSESPGWVKPTPGTGLWTSPVTARTEDGQPKDTAWLEWTRAEMDADTSGLWLTEITPAPGARLLLIDCQEHLIALVNTFPADLGRFDFLSRQYPDWGALAAAGWDGVYLTDRGQWATRLPASGPDLYSWDLESMLWLRCAYTVGRTVRSATRSQAGAA